ncbi:MAG: hypothetical protein OQL08_06630 [Gammaproteobacteria bacterium]|nr:hypothetical protein [Gammaproteobacteria bacterium]
MIEFKHFTISSDPEWKFMEFKSIVIGKHEVNGSKLQLSSAYNHPTFYFKTHKEGLFVAKQFAKVNEEVKSDVLIDNGCKIGCIDKSTSNSIETYFYIIKDGNVVVSVLQGGTSTKEEKDIIASMLSTINYKSIKCVASENA